MSREFRHDDLQRLIGRLIASPRREKLAIIEDLKTNASNYGIKLLQQSYGTFISLLRKTVPIKPMVDFLIPITTTAVVNQTRVDILCDLFTVHSNSPSIARLLQTMRSVADASIYVPPLGCESVIETKLPLRILKALVPETEDGPVPEAVNVYASKISVNILHELTMNKKNDEDLAENLAEYLPLCYQTCRVLPSIEFFADRYLNTIWGPKYNYEATEVLDLLASQFFRFWDTKRSDHLKERLIKPLMNARSSAALVLIPHLYHLKREAVPLMNHLTSIITPSEEALASVYMHIYQFYKIVSLDGPVDIPENVILVLLLKLKVYLFLLNDFASSSPIICKTLMGDFSIDIGEIGNEILYKIFEEDVGAMYCIANSSLIGEVPQLVYKHFNREARHERLTLIIPQTLKEETGRDYNEFCISIIEFLEAAGTPISNYFQWA